MTTVATIVEGHGEVAAVPGLLRRLLQHYGPGGQVTTARAPAPVGAAVTEPPIEARIAAGGVALRWDAAARPMVMVRDPATGEIVSFARGGQAIVATSKRTLDLEVSDGVGSRTERVTVSR